MSVDSSVAVKFDAEIQGLTAGIAQINSQLAGLRGSVAGISDGFRELGAIIGISLSVEGIKSFIENMTSLGEQTERTAHIFWITTEQVGQLNDLATQTGGSGEALVRTLERMALSLQQSADKATPAGVAIRALGLDAKALAQLPLPDMLERLRQRFSELPNSIQKTAVAQTLARNGAENLLPILRLSTAEWARMRDTFRQTGAEMSETTASGFAATGRSITTLEESFTGLGIRIFSVFKPAIDAAVAGVTSFIQFIDTQKITQAGMVIVDWATTIITSVGNLAVDVGGIVDGLMQKFGGYGTALQRFGLGAAGGAVIGGAAAGVGAIPGALVGGFGAITLGQITDWFAGVNQEVGNGVSDTEALKERFDKAVTGYADSIKRRLVIGELAAKLGALHPGGVAPGTGAGGPGLDLNFGRPPKDDAFTKGLAEAGKELTAIQAKTAALHMGTAAAAAYIEAEKLRAIAVAAGRKLTEADKVAIDAEAQAIGAATLKLQQAQAVQATLTDLAQQITDAFMSFDGSLGSLGTAFLKLGVQMAAAIVQALILDAILSALGLRYRPPGSAQ